MSHGKDTGAGYGFPDHVIAAALGVREQLGMQSPAPEPKSERLASLEATLGEKTGEQQDKQHEKLRAQRDYKLDELKAIRDMVQSKRDAIVARQHEEENTLSISDLEAILVGLEGSITILANALSAHQISAGLTEAGIVLKAVERAVTNATTLASTESGQMLHEMMEAKVQAFEAYVKQHGFNAALEASNFSYENSGVVHNYFLQNDAAYRSVTQQLDAEAATRDHRQNDTIGKQDAIAQKYGIDLSDHDEAINATKEELQKAEREGNINRVRDLQAQLAIQTAEREAALQKELEAEKARIAAAGGSTTAIDADIGGSRSRSDTLRADAEQAMAARKQQHDDFMRAMRNAGADGKLLEQYQRDFDKETDKLTSMSTKEISLRNSSNKEVYDTILKEQKQSNSHLTEVSKAGAMSTVADQSAPAEVTISGTISTATLTLTEPEKNIAASGYGMGSLSLTKAASIFDTTPSMNTAQAAARTAVADTSSISGGEEAVQVAAAPITPSVQPEGEKGKAPSSSLA